MQVRDGMKRLIRVFKDRVFSALAITTCVLCIGCLIAVAFPRTAIEKVEVNTMQSTTVGELSDGGSLALYFHSTKAGLTEISFVISTEGRDISAGTLHVRLLNLTGEEVYKEDISCSSLRDNKNFSVSFPKVEDSGDKFYTVLLSTDGLDSSHAISFWANSNVIDGVSTSLNGETSDNLVFYLIHAVVYPYYNYRYAFDLALLAAVFFVLSVVTYKRVKPEEIV
jgi:hypothetical protein